MHIPKHILFLILVVASVTPLRVLGGEEREQEFLITAYYSPKEGQCCYVRGGLAADKILNGEGHTTADGSRVFPGVVAAPPNYPFGTRIELPGIGVVEVRDRGGAIQELADGVHRLDLWVGEGEEGLGRALAVGVLRLTGTVYPVGSPQPSIAFDLNAFTLSLEKLRTYAVGSSLLSVSPRAGDRGISVALLQQSLRDLGFFPHAITGLFGPVTQQELHRFLNRVGVAEPWDRLTERAAAFLTAALERHGAMAPIGIVGRESNSSSIRLAQRILRFLGYYNGRTDGTYGHDLFRSILSFQRNHGIVGSASDSGAGRIGPRTREKVTEVWNRKRIVMRADQLLLKERLWETVLKENPIDRFMGEGESGPHVRALQEFLVGKGMFPKEKVNGVFGSLTEESVLRFQMDSKLVSSVADQGAGYVGPATLRRIRKEHVNELYARVRGHGLSSL